MFKIRLQSEYDDLDKYYYNNGDIIYCKKHTKIIHNPYGPANICKNGYIGYIINDKWHRLDGPARIWPGGYEEYWINHKVLKKEEFEAHPERLKYLDKGHLICLL